MLMAVPAGAAFFVFRNPNQAPSAWARGFFQMKMINSFAPLGRPLAMI